MPPGLERLTLGRLRVISPATPTLKGGHRFLSFNEYYTIALTARLDWGVPGVPLSTRYCYH